MSLYNNNISFSEKWMNEIKSILRNNAMHIIDIEIAMPEEDMKQSTDLKIKITSGDVAVRVRRRAAGFRDLTIRAFSNGNETEIHKLRAGFARWYVYAWEGDGSLVDWILVDLNMMRRAGLLSENRPITKNKDGRTGFVSYSISELKMAGALVARKVAR